MADLKPLGSEKLNGDEKLKRILQLTYYSNPNKTSNKSNTELVRECKSGGVYGIVKEKDGYYVKKGLNESSLDYIGGLFMKNKNRFSSYGEALKRLELLSGQENLQEATKYVLKQKTNSQPAPAPAASEPSPNPAPPSSDETTPPDLGIPSDTEEPTSTDIPSGDEESKRSDYMAEVQKYAGKLGQELRDQKERMEGDDIKYVLNMIISAVDLDKLELEDLEEIGKKFERDEEMGDNDEPNLPEPGAEEEPAGEEPPPSDEDLGETIEKLSDFVKTSAPSDKHEINLSDYADLGNVDETKELDLDEMQREISNSINQTLSKYFK